MEEQPTWRDIIKANWRVAAESGSLFGIPLLESTAVPVGEIHIVALCPTCGAYWKCEHFRENQRGDSSLG